MPEGINVRGTKLFVVTSCKVCPNCEVKATPGAGTAIDRKCKKTNRYIKGYIEYPSEDVKDGEFPAWCPLKEGPEQ